MPSRNAGSGSTRKRKVEVVDEVMDEVMDEVWMRWWNMKEKHVHD